jgi:hypothetical protein
MLVSLVLVAATVLPVAQAVTSPLPAEAGFGRAAEGEAERASCFTMQPPGPGWRRLELDELREVYPEAEVGLEGPHGVQAVLCVRTDPSQDLAGCVDRLLEEQLLEQSRPTFRESTRIDGRDAAHALVTGRRDGTWWRYLATAFREGEELYLLLAWGRSDDVPADGTTLLEAALGLQRVEGVGFDELARADSALDADGPGWRVRGGVYRDAALGFALVPRGAWRVASRAELAPLGTHVHAGLLDELHGALLGFVAERAPGVQHGDYAEDARRKAIGPGHNSGTRQARIAGREVELRRFALPSPTGFADGTVRGVFAVFFEGERCFQVIGRYPATAEQSMGRSLPQGLASLQLLGEGEVRELAAVLLRERVDIESVGPGWCLRGGVFTDFRNGLRWTLPPGFWEVQSGAGGPGEPTLELYERNLGVRGWIRVDQGPAFAGEAGHRLAQEALNGGRLRVPAAPAARVTLGQLEGFASSCDLREQRTSVRALLVSGGNERCSVRLCLRAPIETMERHAEPLAAAVRALSVYPAQLTPTAMSGGVYSDARMGFELRAPRADWRFGERPLDRFGPRAAEAQGVLVSFEGADGQGVYAAAAWTEAGPDGIDGPFATWIPTALQSAVALPEGPPLLDERGELNGVPCRFLSWTVGGRTVELALATRSRTAFAVAAVRTGAGDGPRAWLAGFRRTE